MGYDNEYARTVYPSWMVFDLETMSMPGCAEYLTDPISAPSNYKDQAKIDAYIAEKRQRQIDEAALDLDLCEVVAIGGQFHNRQWAQTRETASEAEMVDGFWRFVRNVQKDHGLLVGFNVLTFDLPVLIRRSMYLGIPYPAMNVDRYRHEGVVDVADVLTFSGRMPWRSLAFYAKRFGIHHDGSVPSEDIPKLAASNCWSEVEKHLRADLETTTALALRIGSIVAPVGEAVAEAVA